MHGSKSTLMDMRAALLKGATTPRRVVERALPQANSNLGKNVYLSLDAERALSDAETVKRAFREKPKPALYGLAISLKDCFDLEGHPTTCGSRYYAEKCGPARIDSAMALRLREQGAIMIGKTHLNPLAYGLTGENADYGD